ncbi:class II glutamine amidotransferase [Bacteriovoracaceae bacterium]|nr:class II glutamine amidotransferase [Bacteriovoracaceae bacterium]|tara:strand:- start:49339 stop:50178 length:840 start_codon:yes stop_codon:yes gene_type:complete
MCRLFGFRSVILSQVHTSLLDAENALAVQSNMHPDGWGVSYYLNGAPHVVKSATSAINDSIFKKVSGVVSSNTVLAHIRKATLGNNNILNTHPFQFGHWVFAHNGNIKSFDSHREEIRKKIHAKFKRFILGDTDSELLFFLLLSKLENHSTIDGSSYPIDKMVIATKEAIDEIVSVAGEMSQIDNAGETETYLTFIITNGTSMLAHQGGKNLYYSTYKKRCPDRDTCPSLSDSCEAPTKDGNINHLIFSSEPLSGENIWIKMDLGQIIGVDGDMKIKLT